MKKTLIIAGILFFRLIAALYATVEQKVVAVNPYTETTVNLGYAKSVKISSGGKNIRVALDDATTVDTGNYWKHASADQPLEIQLFKTTILKLKGDTASETTNVRMIIQR